MLTRSIRAVAPGLAQAGALVALLALGRPAHAATFNIPCPGGVGDVAKLANAFTTAASNGEADTIVLARSCTYTLTAISDTSMGNTAFTAVTADGGFATTVQGNGSTIFIDPNGQVYGRFFLVNGGTLNVDGTTLLDGYAHGDGGSILVQSGTLNLSNSTLTMGIGQDLGTYGGCLAVEAAGTANVDASTFTQCNGVTGGAIANVGGTLSVFNSTIATNESQAGGGAIAATGGTTRVLFTTVFNNVANASGAGPGGGGFYSGGGTFSVGDTILGDNGSPNAGTPEDVAGAFVDVGHNIVAANQDSPSFTVSTLVGPTATEMSQLIQLNGLASNGGPTQTVSLGSQSIAAGAADQTACAAPPVNGVDQTGAARLAGYCDIGAYQIPRTLGLSLTSTQNPAPFGQSLDLVGYIAVVNGGPAPTGTFSFVEGSKVIGSGSIDGNSQFDFATSSLSVGSHDIALKYGGDAIYPVSKSSLYVQVIDQATSGTTLISSTNPSTFGGSVTFTATVTPSNVSGVVTFLDGAATLGTGRLSGGVASLTTTKLSAGSHPITASYAETPEATASTSSTLTQIVNQEGLTAALTSSASPSSLGELVTFTAKLTPATSGAQPTGTVTFVDGTTTLGTGTLSAGVATFKTGALTVGTHSITATYAGDTDFAAQATAALVQTVDKGTLKAALASSKNPSNAGETVTFTATLTDAATTIAPTGKVTFLDGTSTLGTSTLTAGTGKLDTSALTVGRHTITAAYPGDANFAAVTTSHVIQVVDAVGVPDAGHPDGGHDAGIDASGKPDAGSQSDAGKGGKPDAAKRDSGAPSDAAAATDATIDGGAGEVGSSGGCAVAPGTDASSSFVGLGAFALAFLFIRRRHRV